MPGSADRPFHCPTVLCVARSREGTYYEHQAIARDPDRASNRAKRDEELRRELLRVWQENRTVYGARKRSPSVSNAWRHNGSPRDEARAI